MALEGTLKDFPLPDIIQLLSLSRKTGAVEIVGTDGFGTGRLYFHQGKVVSAALDDLLAPDAAFAFSPSLVAAFASTKMKCPTIRPRRSPSRTSF